MHYSIAVHGGAGPAYPGEDPAPIERGCEEAASAGFAILAAGGSALDAVVAAAVVLENDPLFNAGTGSCLTEDEDVEMDASVMDGSALRAGAVAALREVKNPVLVARAVMDHTPHVLLCAAGAERFAREQGFPRVDTASLITERARRRFEEERVKRASGGGTIGAVACDGRGVLAAATSTGGMNFKRRGRIGDTPLIGAGTYADDQAGAASATGHGESIIKVLLGKAAVDLMRGGATPQHAAAAALEQLDRVGGTGGLILVNPRGEVGFAFNTERMSRAWRTSGGGAGVAFGK